jgi:hypothetical protein
MEKQGKRTEIWSVEALVATTFGGSLPEHLAVVKELWWDQVMAEQLVLGSVQLLVIALVEM